MIIRGFSSTSRFLVIYIAVLLGTLGFAICSHHHKYRDSLSAEDERAWKEFKEFREWKKSRNEWERHGPNYDLSSNERDRNEHQQLLEKDIKDAIENFNVAAHVREHLKEPKEENKRFDPPPSDEPALMGRFIVNQADWTSVATISSRKDIESFPFANVISVSDGPLGNGTGIPYMYLTPLDFTAQDVARDHRATLMMTLAEGSWCKQKVMDPMDPRCARIVLTGKIKTVKPDSPELEVAKNAVFGRHPWLAHMPADHHFFFAKLKIGSIAVLDAFGGPKYVTVKDYFHPPGTNGRRGNLRSKYLTYETGNNYSNNRFANRI